MVTHPLPTSPRKGRKVCHMFYVVPDVNGASLVEGYLLIPVEEADDFDRMLGHGPFPEEEAIAEQKCLNDAIEWP